MNKNRLSFFCPHWGSEHLGFQTFLDKVKAEGYDGVEMSLPFEESKRTAILESIAKNGLQLIAQHWETLDADFETHVENYKRRLHNLALAKPLFINSQTGKDYFSFEQNEKLIDVASEIELSTGIPIYHETHRGKFSFASHITQRFLDKIPGLQLTLDISHWCCVAETLLEDQEDAVAKAIEHTKHIHSRVGFAQAPQVMDPRAPEWQSVVEQHIHWWLRVYQKNLGQGKDTTITAEFGPAPYLPLLPYTQMPIYNQWEVNVFMMHLLRSRLK